MVPTRLQSTLNQFNGINLLQVMGKTSVGKWSRSAGVGPSSLKCDPLLPTTLKRQLAAKKHFSLSDFDDHLDNLQRYAAGNLMWRNYLGSC